MEIDSIKASIENLTDEILIEIFSFLSPKLKKIALLVCVRWNEILTQNRNLMKCFKLCVTPSYQTAINRKLQSLKFNMLMNPKIDLIKSENVRSLEMNHCDLQNHALSEILSSMNQLQSFTAHSLKLNDNSENTTVKCIQLSKLSTLDIKFSSISIFDTFSSSSLKNFSFQNIEHQINPEPIISLLLNQNHLKDLHLAGSICENILKHQAIINLTCKLKILKIEKVDLNSHDRSLQFLEFLKPHKNSINELITTRVHTLLKRFILMEMPNLTSLSLSFEPSNLNEIKNISPLANVTRFKILGSLNPKNTTDILKLFPALKALNMMHLTIKNAQDFCNIFDFVHRHFPSLQELHLANLQFYDEDCEKFRNLKQFHVGKILDESHYNLFLRDHAATLEKISIENIKDDDFVRGLTVNAISHCRNLRHISFMSQSSVVTKMFKKIKIQHPWILESKFNAVDSTKTIKLVFRFPDDESVFNEHCSTWDDKLIREFTTVSSYGLNAFVNKFK